MAIYDFLDVRTPMCFRNIVAPIFTQIHGNLVDSNLNLLGLTDRIYVMTYDRVFWARARRLFLIKLCLQSQKKKEPYLFIQFAARQILISRWGLIFWPLYRLKWPNSCDVCFVHYVRLKFVFRLKYKQRWRRTISIRRGRNHLISIGMGKR